MACLIKGRREEAARRAHWAVGALDQKVSLIHEELRRACEAAGRCTPRCVITPSCVGR